MLMKKFLFISIIAAIFSSCGKTTKEDTVNHTDNGSVADITDSSIVHARYFNISERGTYKAVDVYDPWNEGAVLATYYIVKDSCTQVPSDGYKIKVPIENIALNSCSHVGFTDLLGCMDKVCGMSSTKYVYNHALLDRVEKGLCTDIGDSFALNFEKTATLPIEAIMVTKYNSPDKNIERLQQAGIPVIYNVEWMEPDILGRAEWIKFFGAFFCKEAEADSIFNSVCESYETLANKAAKVEIRPTIMTGMPFKGTWYMPAGNSYMAKLFTTAGGNYKYSDTGGNGSLPLSLETVLAEFSESDVWVGADAKSLAEIQKSDKRLTMFKPYIDKKVYNHGKRTTPDGGNDFWEMGVARPDLLLQDLIIILHPEILDNESETYFMERLK